jgi:hypothetical protein
MNINPIGHSPDKFHRNLVIIEKNLCLFLTQKRYHQNPEIMKRILTKWDKFKLGRRLHYLQKRLHRAEENGYQEKIEKYQRYIKEVQEKLKHIKE